MVLVIAAQLYNQFSLSIADRHEITICTFFRVQISVPSQLTVFTGNDTVKGFWHALQQAIDAGEYDIIHAHSPYMGVFLLFAPRHIRQRLPMNRTIYTFHSSFPNYRLKHKIMMIPIMAMFRYIVCCGQSSFKSVPGCYRVLAGNRLQTIPNGVDIDRVDRVIKQYPRTAEKTPFTIVVIGRLIAQKNPGVTLQAFYQLRKTNSRLIFLGEGPLRKHLQVEAQRLDIAHQILLPGMVEREKVFQHLAQADVFVSMSTVEGLPVAVLEAMVSQCPTILSDIPPHKEISATAQFVQIVPQNDVARLATKLEELFAMPPEQRQLIGQDCRNSVVEHFSLQGMHKAYDTLYHELMTSRA